MQIISVVQIALLASTQVSAAPFKDTNPLASSSTTQVTKRADPAPVSCGPPENQRAWPLESVQNAFQGLVNNGNLPDPQKPAANGRVYPRQVGKGSQPPREAALQAALDAIPECATSLAGDYKWFEFPITDPPFAGCTDPACQGPDRVIAISKNAGQGGTRTFTYCLSVTHRGLSNSDFQVCENAP